MYFRQFGDEGSFWSWILVFCDLVLEKLRIFVLKHFLTWRLLRDRENANLKNDLGRTLGQTVSGLQWQGLENVNKFQQIQSVSKSIITISSRWCCHTLSEIVIYVRKNIYVYIFCLLYSKICASEINILQVCLVSKQTPQGMKVRDQLSWEILTIKFKVCNFLQSKKHIFKSRYQNLQVCKRESLKSEWLILPVSPFRKILVLHSN